MAAMNNPRLDSTGVVADAARAQRRGSDPALSTWVTASAGSGKTKVLGDRVLRLLLEGWRPTGILCLTFTRAAAAEMANRIADRLRDWAVMEHEKLRADLLDLTGAHAAAEITKRARGLFAKVLDAPGGMRIETIHAFCQSLLRRFPLEAEVAPHFRLIEERDAAELLSEARETMLRAARAGDNPELAAAFGRAVGRMQESGLDTVLREFLRQRDRLQRLEMRMGSAEGLRRAMAGLLGIPPDATARSILREACADHALDHAALKRAASALMQGGVSDRRRGEVLLEWLALAAEHRAERYDGCKRVYFTQEGALLKRLATAAAVKHWPDVAHVLEAEARRMQAVLERVRAAECLGDSHALTVLALDLETRYRKLKAMRAALDYDDLILKARDLLLRPGIAPWVLYKLDGGIDHILVDEAQDTNHHQWDLIKALTEEFFSGTGAQPIGRTVFAVGDRKQSIFSFQGAEPAAAAAVRDYYADRLRAVRRDDPRPAFVDVPLDVSFRSTGAVLKLVDAVIAGPARAGVLEEGASLHHRVSRIGQAGSVELWPRAQPVALSPPEPWAIPRVAPGLPAPEERLALAIAARIGDLLGTKLESRDRNIRPGDILVLVRSRDAFVPALVRALKARDIPVSGIDRLKLLQEIAVMDLIAFAEFLLMPEDDLTLAALLKSPLIGLDEEELFRICVDRKGASVWSRLNMLAPDSPRLRAAVQLLGTHLARADFHSPFALFAELLGQGGGRKRIHARLGSEADETIDEFLNLALAYEQGDTPSLQGFLRWLRSTEATVKRELGDASAGEVRIMTVHGAKGLQAPIVFLADKPAFEHRATGLFWIEAAGGLLPLWSPNKGADIPATAAARDEARKKRQEESNRLLYVALTRAEDRLIVCGRMSARAATEPGWHEQVAAAFAQLPAAVTPVADWTPPAAIGPAGGDPEGWVGDHLRYGEKQTAAPEAARPKDGLAVAEPAELPAWAARPVAPEPDPPQPLIPSRPSEAEPAVISPIAGDQGTRFKRGLLVHRLLELLPLVAADQRGDAAARFLERRTHGLTREQAEEVRREVLRILEDPALAALFGPESLAEVPVVATLRDPQGKIQALTGQIDRLLVCERDCVIVDYKSNRPPPMQASQVSPAYLRQLAAYRAAIAAVYPGKSISCKILWSVEPRLMDIPTALLDIHAPAIEPGGAVLDQGKARP
jgi:ATP-dependent helicase/nuclease subunit A